MVEYHITIRTLIPEADSYGIAILTILGISSFSLAANIHSRWLSETRIRILHVYCAALGFTCAWGFLVLKPDQLLRTSALAWTFSLPVGLAAGVIARWGDRTMIRFINRRSVLRQRRKDRSKVPGPRMARSELGPVRLKGVLLASKPAQKQEQAFLRVRQPLHEKFDHRDAGVWLLVMVAVLEELVYRGFLVGLCWLLPNTTWITLALAGTVIVFTLSHIWFGWEHVLAKIPLGIMTLLSVIALGTVLPAIVAHVFFNLSVWKDMRSVDQTANHHLIYDYHR